MLKMLNHWRLRTESLNQGNENVRFHLKNGVEFQKLSLGPSGTGEG